MAPNEARKTLGCLVTPTHNQKPQFDALMKETEKWVASINFSSLCPRLRIKAYESVYLPKMTYRLSTTSFSYADCDKLVSKLRPTILHAHNTHEHFPKVILEANTMYAGFNFTHLYDVQGYEKMKFFIYHMRKQDDTGKAFLISLQYLQLTVGIGRFILNEPYQTYSFLVDPTWITNFWQYLSNRSLSLDVSHQVHIPFQRANDKYLMDLIFPHFSIEELKKINKIRLSLKLLFLSDVINIRGRHLLHDIRNGLTYRSSTLNFPAQTYPKKWLKLWRSACNHWNLHASANPLGVWHCHHFTWDAQISQCKKFMRVHTHWFHQKTLASYTPMNIPPPNDGNLVMTGCDVYKSKQNYILIQGEPTVRPLPPPPPSDTSFQLFGLFERENESTIVDIIKQNKARMCCDGSVKSRLGSFAYGLATSGTDSLSFLQHAPVHGDEDQMSSTRCELMGLLACVSYLNYLSQKYTFDTKYFILIIADNEPAIKATSKKFNAIKHTFAADIDIILQLQYEIKQSPFLLKFKHIKGHQDRHSDYCNLSTLAKLNVKMDKHAKAYFTHPVSAPSSSVNSPFLPQSIVSIRDYYSRITCHFKKNLRRYATGSAAEEQLSSTTSIPLNHLSHIDWYNFRRATTSIKRSQLTFLAKLIHNQLPTQYRNFRWKQTTSSICPLCKQQKEDITHLFQCTHPSIISNRNSALSTLKDTLNTLHTDPLLLRHVLRVLHQFINNYQITPIPETNEDLRPLSRAFRSQELLGFSYFMRGFISHQFIAIQQSHYDALRLQTSTGDNWSKNFIIALISFSQNIWKYRCELIAKSTEASYEDNIRRECTTLLFRLNSSPQSLPVSFRFLLKKRPEYMKTAPLRSLQSWLTRTHLGLRQAKSGAKNSSMDIRNWFSTVLATSSDNQQQSSIFSSPIDEAYDSDDTYTAFLRDYPDEDTTAHKWIPRKLPKLRTKQISKRLRQLPLFRTSTPDNNLSPSSTPT